MSDTSKSRQVLDIELEAAARASFLKMSPARWRVVCLIEKVLWFFTLLLPSLKTDDRSELQPPNILVIEYWNLGDLAILVPFLKNLRRSFPQSRISLIVKDGLASFLEGQGLIDEFISIKVPWAQHFNRVRKYNPLSKNWISFALTLSRLRKQRFDCVFSGRMDIRDNFLMWLTGARRRVGYGLGGGGFLLTDRISPDLSHPHRADIWLQLLKAVGGIEISENATIRVSEQEIAQAEALIDSCGIPRASFLFGIHPGARIATRRWGDDRFAEVVSSLQRHDVHFLWFSDPLDPSPAPPIERCHQVTAGFRLFLAVLARCRLLLCNDSGPMHLANLLGVPVVAVFGSTNPVWFGPRGTNDRVVIRPEFWCRPCFDYCIYDRPYCLRTISTDEVLASAQAALRSLEEGVPSESRTGLEIS